MGMKKELLTLTITLLLLFIAFSGCVEDRPGGGSEHYQEPEEEAQRLNFSNMKNLSRYEDKMVFLISDKNWRNVLSLVPLSIWTNSNSAIMKYPLLIYHDETNEKIPVDITHLANSSYMGIWDYIHGQYYQVNITGISVSKNLVDFGEDFTLNLKVKNLEHQAINLSITPINENSLHIQLNEINQLDPARFFYDIFNFTDMIIEDADQVWILGEEINISFNFRLDYIPGFDVDSTLYFMEQYLPKQIVSVGTISKELQNLILNLESNPQIITIEPEDYISYWNVTEGFIIVDYNDYATGLIASTFASYYNAPIFFIDSDNLNEYKDLINERQVALVGSIDPSVVDFVDFNAENVTSYSLQELQKGYAKLTDTDKIILVNPKDLNNSIIERILPEKTEHPVFSLYSKTSLMAPILGAARHELILNVPSDNCEVIDQYIENEIETLDINASYLTIVASPNAIQMSRDAPEDMIEPYGVEEVDNHLYGNLGEDFFQELAVGRIFGITTSDVSSYIARDLFYDDLPHFSEFAVMAGERCSYCTIPVIGELLLSAGYTGYANVDKETSIISNVDLTNLENKFVIIYTGHGTSTGLQRGITSYQLNSDKIWLDSPIFFAEACNTCDFNECRTKEELFAANIIRRGGLAYMGAVTSSGPEMVTAKGFAEAFLYTDLDIGQIVRLLKNREAVMDLSNSKIQYSYLLGSEEIEGKKLPDYEKHYVLIGDPLINISVSLPDINENELTRVSFNATSNSIELNVPSVIKDCILEDNSGGSMGNEMYTKEVTKGFSVPYSNIGICFGRGHVDIYNGSQFMDSLSAEHDGVSFVFYVDLPQNIEIKSIERVEYIQNDEQKIISEMPIFPSAKTYAEPDKFIYYYKDDDLPNRYWFYLRKTRWRSTIS